MVSLLRLFGCLLLLSTASLHAADKPCRASAKGVEATPQLAILQGPTDETSTQLAILVRQREPVTLWLSRDGEAPRKAKTEEKTFPDSPWRVLRATFSGLAPAAEYRLLACDVAGNLVDERLLSTMNLKKAAVRFAVASCMDDFYEKEQKGMWEGLVSHRPDVLFLIGDNSYADFVRPKLGVEATPSILWRRHAETRNLLQVFRERRLIPIYSVWDDHDFGKNDGGADFRYKKESRDIFTAFFPRDPMAAYVHGPGLASRLSAFGQRFYLLDDRYFRTKETHLGAEQEAWLYADLKKNDEPAWLFDGDQYFGAYHRFESFEGNHPAAFAKFLAALKAIRAPVVFVSGDRHLVELMELKETDLGYKSYELTTSAIHAKTFPDAWAKSPNPRKIEGASGTFNYVVVDSRVIAGALEATLFAYGPERRELFRKTVTVRR